jgi:hypothetical protein
VRLTRRSVATRPYLSTSRGSAEVRGGTAARDPGIPSSTSLTATA